MKDATKQKINHEAEVSDLRELFFSKFEAVWNEMEYFKKLSKIPPAEADQLALWWLFCLAAETSINVGQTKEEFLESVTTAFDESLEEEDESEEEEGEEDDGEENVVNFTPKIVPSVSVEDIIRDPLGNTKAEDDTAS